MSHLFSAKYRTTPNKKISKTPSRPLDVTEVLRFVSRTERIGSAQIGILGNYSLLILCVFHVSSLDSSRTERSLVRIINVFSEDLLIRKSENNNNDSDNR